ncbi:MAG: ATP-grasp domain-containing protein [Muribaculaceae bacterium]|nr:ATP-grasp domain-containing protein [Muribaculaceae bacterium]
MRQPLNVLMLGGAKRVSMARLFVKTAARLGYDAAMYSFELGEDVPIASVAEVITGGRWSDPTLMTQLHHACVDKHIDIILPFVDGAVEVAAKYCQTNPQVWSPVSLPEVSRAMFDKKAADDILRAKGVPLPRVVDTPEPQFFPVIAKPRTGSASKGIMVADNIEQWREMNLDTDRYIVQEYIRNRKEYTLDCYIDHRGNISAISPRLRLEVVGGEVSRTITVHLPSGEDIARRAIMAVGLRGAVTVQLIENTDTGELMLMEINPRLGGGAVCSVYAGVDLPYMIISDWLGHYVEYMVATPDVEMTRYMQEVVFGPDRKEILKSPL